MCVCVCVHAKDGSGGGRGNVTRHIDDVSLVFPFVLFLLFYSSIAFSILYSLRSIVKNRAIWTEAIHLLD